MRRTGDGLEEVDATSDRVARVKGLLSLRDQIRTVLSAEGSGDRVAAATARTALDSDHDRFVERFGPVSWQENAIAIHDDPDARLLAELDRYDRGFHAFVKGRLLRDRSELPPRSTLIIFDPSPRPKLSPTTTVDASERTARSGELSRSVRAALERGESIDNRRLTAMADSSFGGSRARGAYSVKDAYDAVEVGVNEYFEGRARALLGARPHDALAEIREVFARLPRQTDGDRTPEQEIYQQFSTPPTLAFIAARALEIRPGDVVVEPSAGTGALAVWARAAGAAVVVNELSGRRRALLEAMGFAACGVDAEHLDDLLPSTIQPTAILMNPPFSATAGRLDSNNTKFGFHHVAAALERLRDGGRLVAVLPEGAAFDKARASSFWSPIFRGYTVRANIGLPGAEYSRYGTRYPNQLVVVDKIGATPGSGFEAQVEQVLWPKVASYEEAIDVLNRIPERVAVRVARVGDDARDARGNDRRPVTDDSRGDRTAAAGDRARGSLHSARTSGPGGDGPRRDGDEPRNRPDESRDGGTGDGRDGDSRDARASEWLKRAGVVYSSNARAARVTEEGGTFVSYVAAKIRGGRPHPADLVESASMAAVEPPDPTYVPYLEPTIIRDGVLSDVQLERVIYAGQRHEQLLADGARGGFYVGDGTGVGKGRVLAGIILDNWEQGRRRALWLSVNYDLVSSTARDLTALGGDVPLHAMNEQSYEPLEIGDGVLFSSYSSLIGKSKDGRTRLDQICRWLGDDAVVIFDEGHKAKNALGTVMGEPTQTGQAVIDLQSRLPSTRVVYASATGATEVRNMAYMTRLGVWGPGTAFPGGFAEFLAEIESGGVGSMEMVARDLKALGLYGSASISYKGVDYRESIHELGVAQREIYDAAAGAWQMVFGHIEDALGVTNAGRRERARALIAFWGDHQRFFRQLTTALKVPTAIREIDRALEAQKSVVVSLIGTGEARAKELIAQATAAGDSLDDLNFAPVDVIRNLVRRAFPTTKFEEYTDPITGSVRRRPVVDKDGNRVESKAALRMREELLGNLEGLVLPEGPLDQLVNHYGPSQVAELTGRKKRLVYNPVTKHREYVPRLAGVAAHLMNEHEMRSFQSGQKRIAIISDAASTGISLHASNESLNRQRRVHVTLELGWSADKQMQTFGRTHRSDQAMPPEYVLLATELGGERRFCSTIARRLASLGALTKGQRDASGAGDLARYNFETQYGEAATQAVYRALERDRVPEDLAPAIDDPRSVLADMGLIGRRPGEDPTSVRAADLQDVGRFLNRVLALDVRRQNAVFEMFAREFDQTVRYAKARGLFDEGVADVKGLSIRLKDHPNLVHTDETTGARTSHFALVVREETHPITFERADSHRRSEKGSAFYVQKRSGNAILVEPAGSRTDAATGVALERYRVHRPQGFNAGHIIDQRDLVAKYDLVAPDGVRERWTEQFNSDPGYRDRDVHVIGGALLPIWNRMKLDEGASLRIVRIETDEGERLVGVEIPPKQVARVLRSVGRHPRSSPGRRGLRGDPVG